MPTPTVNCIKLIQENRATLKNDAIVPAAKEKCPPNIKKKDEARIPGRPVVLSQKRFERILNEADTQKSKKKEQEEAYKESMKQKGSDALTANFTGDNIHRNHERKLARLKEEAEEKALQARESLEANRQNEEKIRQEKLEKAEELVKKLLPGPRALHIAALQSEVLRARDIQMCIKADFEKAVAEQERLNMEKCSKGNLMFIGEELQRMEERKKFEEDHKKEMQEAMRENERRKLIEKDLQRKRILEERRLMDAETSKTNQEEQEYLQKKRLQLRRNLMEARAMAEERRMREKMRDELDDRLCCVYNAGKFALDKMKKSQNLKNYEKRLCIMDCNYKRLAKLQTQSETDENMRIKRDLELKEAKFEEEEKEKRRKLETTKQARINDYLHAMQQQYIKKNYENEIKRFELAQRFKNCETNALFERNQKEEQLKRVKETREDLKKQEEERQNLLKEYAAAERDCVDTRYLEEDKYFLNYARQLIEDAEKKQRPLHPFERAVNEYKSRNGIDCVEKVPKHLRTNLRMGCRQPGDSEAVQKAEEEKKRDPLKSLKTDIFIACGEIDKILHRQHIERDCQTPKSASSKATTKPRRSPRRKGRAVVSSKASSKTSCRSKSPCTPAIPCISVRGTAPSTKSSIQSKCCADELKKMNVTAAPSLQWRSC